MQNDPFFYAVAIPAVVLMGLAKGGFAGVGQVAVPLLTLAVSPVQAAAILLPTLLVQDMVAVWSFRRTWDRSILTLMLPSAAVGILAAFLLASTVSVAAVMFVLGVVSIVFAAYQLWRRKSHAVLAPSNASPAVGVALGIAAGFTSQIAHAGVPPFHMWVLPKRLAPTVFIGTSAIFFAVVNWLKVPAYFALGQFTPDNMQTALILMPVAIISTFAGVWLVKRVPAEGFYTAIYVLMMAVGGELIWKAVVG